MKHMKKWVFFLYSVLFIAAFALSSQAQVDIVSYCDVTLESCRSQDQALLLLEDKYPHDISVEFLYYFDVSDVESSMSHIALECAASQGMKDEYKLTLQNNVADLSRDGLVRYASELSLYMTNFTFCLDTASTAWAVLEQIEMAEEDGAYIAPSVRINMDMYTGSQTFTSLHALVLEYMGLTKEKAQEVMIDTEETVEGPVVELVEQEVGEEELVLIDEPEAEEYEPMLFFRVVGPFWDWLASLGQ
jgi:hypothetical protein